MWYFLYESARRDNWDSIWVFAIKWNTWEKSNFQIVCFFTKTGSVQGNWPTVKMTRLKYKKWKYTYWNRINIEIDDAMDCLKDTSEAFLARYRIWFCYTLLPFRNWWWWWMRFQSFHVLSYANNWYTIFWPVNIKRWKRITCQIAKIVDVMPLITITDQERTIQYRT